MLTTTYSFVVFSSELLNARRLLQKLEHRPYKAAHHGPAAAQGIDLAWLDAVFNDIVQIDKYCHARKVEIYVIPLLRRALVEPHALLDRLDALSAETVRLLRAACEQAQRLLDGAQADAAALVSAIDRYCATMLERLQLEETELLPAAHLWLSADDWFRIAAQLLSDGKPQQAPAMPIPFGSIPCGQRQLPLYAVT
ncbi:hypothetical protein GCM10027343_15820 [Noviherbaspirillum agri]